MSCSTVPSREAFSTRIVVYLHTDADTDPYERIRTMLLVVGDIPRGVLANGGHLKSLGLQF